MFENTAINNFITYLPMPSIIVDKKGYIVFANYLYREKFKFDRLSKKNKVKLQTFLNIGIENILKRLFSGDTSVSTYDYKLNDLDENEITADLHFNKIDKNFVLLIIQEKDNFKTYMTQTSKILGEHFINGFSNSLDRNLIDPVTIILGSVELLNNSNNKDESVKKKLLDIITMESNKVKGYLDKITYFQENISYNSKKTNIHICINEAIEKLSNTNFKSNQINKKFDPSIPEVSFDKEKLVKCFYNVILNAYESKSDNEIDIITKINHDMYIRSDDLQKVLKLPIHIKIIDYGPGVNESIEQFMFYPFVSKKNLTDGLGLTYVNIIISKYGGYFKYEKEKNATVFNIYLPLTNTRSENN